MTKILRRPYLLLVVCLLAASTNIGLINRHVAIQDGAGENIVGLRDILMVLVVFLGFFVGRGRRLLQSGLAQIALGILCLTPVAIWVGFTFGAQPYAVLSDGVTMSAWILALLLGQYLQNAEELELLCGTIVGLGVAVSVGVLIEGASGGTVALVTPGTEALSSTLRSTPTGWPMMMMAGSCLTVLILQGPRRVNAVTLWRIALLGVIVVASLLTQSRTLLVGIAASSLIYLGLCAVFSASCTRWLYVVAVAGLATIVLPVTVLLGQAWVRADFGDVFLNRYSVLFSSDAAERHLEEEGRMLELEAIFGQCLPESPLLGFGLASPYQPDSDVTEVHCAFGFFFLRYGLPGLLLWILLIAAVLQLTVHFVRSEGPLRRLGQAFSLAMLNLVICASFGNQFGAPYGVQQSMVALGALIACQQLDRRFASRPATWHKRAVQAVGTLPAGSVRARLAPVRCTPAARPAGETAA